MAVMMVVRMVVWLVVRLVDGKGDWLVVLLVVLKVERTVVLMVGNWVVMMEFVLAVLMVDEMVGP